MADKCQYECRQAEKFEKIAAERGMSLACLQSIDTTLKEIKDNGRRDRDEIWDAINGMRSDIKSVNERMQNDIKSIYWRIGLVSGSLSIITSLLMNVAVKGGGIP